MVFGHVLRYVYCSKTNGGSNDGKTGSVANVAEVNGWMHRQSMNILEDIRNNTRNRVDAGRKIFADFRVRWFKVLREKVTGQSVFANCQACFICSIY